MIELINTTSQPTFASWLMSSANKNTATQLAFASKYELSEQEYNDSPRICVIVLDLREQ